MREQLTCDALRKDVECKVEKTLFDAQARHLVATKYVHHDNKYRTDLVERLPIGRREWCLQERYSACQGSCLRALMVVPSHQSPAENHAVRRSPDHQRDHGSMFAPVSATVAAAAPLI